MQILDWGLLFSFNIIIFGTAIWVVLRNIEKIYDIQIKAKQLDEMDRQ